MVLDYPFMEIRDVLGQRQGVLRGVVSDSLGDDVVCVEGVGAGELHGCEPYNRG